MSPTIASTTGFYRCFLLRILLWIFSLDFPDIDGNNFNPGSHHKRWCHSNISHTSHMWQPWLIWNLDGSSGFTPPNQFGTKHHAMNTVISHPSIIIYSESKVVAKQFRLRFQLEYRQRLPWCIVSLFLDISHPTYLFFKPHPSTCRTWHRHLSNHLAPVLGQLHQGLQPGQPVGQLDQALASLGQQGAPW